MYNVEYDAPDGTRRYLAESCDHATATKQCAVFTERYVGKPYPNGLGYYPFTNPRVVEIRAMD